MALISDRTANVKFKLGNRTDIDTKIEEWYRDAYLEIAYGYPFEELEETVHDTMVKDIDAYDYPDEARGIKVITIEFDTGERRLRRRHIRNIERYQSTLAPGQPALYAPFGNQIIVRPVPSASFNFRWRIWKKPTIEDTLADTLLEVPDDWLEILDYAATIRGHTDLLERDKAGELHAILHGGSYTNSDGTVRRFPGIIKQRLLRRQAEHVDSEYAIRPLIRRYTSSA